MAITTRIITALVLLPIVTARVAAQVTFEGLVRTDRYWGASTGFADDGSPLSFRPFRPQFFGVRVGTVGKRIRLSLGGGISKPAFSAESPDGTTIVLPGSNKQVELDVQLAARLLEAGQAARVWAYVAPMVNAWRFVDASKTTLGGAIGFETEIDLSKRASAVTRVSVAVQASPLQQSDLPEGYTTQALWRRSIGIGLRYRL